MRWRLNRTFVGLFLMLPALGVALELPRQGNAWSVTLENDLFFGTDRYYTNGIQLEWAQHSPRGLVGGEDSPLLRSVCEVAGCIGLVTTLSRHRVGQLMYTPRDISIREAQPQDRPWAGMLYYSNERTFSDAAKREEVVLTAQIGAVGPIAKAGQTQRLVHDTFSGRDPLGWGNQIGNEVSFLVMLEKRGSIEGLSFTLPSNIDMRAVRHWRVAGGTIMTFVGVGVEITLGKNLPDLPVRPGDIEIKKTRSPDLELMSLPDSFAQSPLPSRSSCVFDWLECSLAASVEARLMAHNIFLDGPIFRQGPSVKSRPLVLDAALAFRLVFPRSRTASHGPLFVQFKLTNRSPEFRSQLKVPSQTFGALTVGRTF